ncbi:hypothetical protein OBV_p-00260 (plasmid) [Oscillibacter valericigenes Sjm18-20]|nr:hypothetical protein OBV_p-00260 [Oscillibacter valericigenes Sjm18-20]
MFDWFRYVAEEMGGIDSEAAKRERLEKKEKAKLNRFIFTKLSKAIVIAAGVLYLSSAGAAVFAMKSTGYSIPFIVKFFVLSVVDIGVIISLVTGKKKGEIAALIGCFVFVVILYLSIVI